ncbi:MAG: YciI family protein [Acidimicrobiia bacterium]|nr:YciI family protein [Acidimicrobiia bacterium]
MAKYALVFHGGGMPETEEESAKVMAAWGAWMEGLGKSLADPGHPFGASTTINSDGSTAPGGGANPATGYTLIEADSLDAAVTLAKDCPILHSGGSIEVAEALDM